MANELATVQVFPPSTEKAYSVHLAAVERRSGCPATYIVPALTDNSESSTLDSTERKTGRAEEIIAEYPRLLKRHSGTCAGVTEAGADDRCRKHLRRQ
jgi:hypothetical protein